MKKKSSIILIYFLNFCFFTNVLISQNQDFINDYDLSVCKGKLPADFSVNIINKTKADIENDEFELSISKKRKFYENSNYFIYNFLNGGKVLFGDVMTNYVNQVASNLLEKSGNSKLKKDLKFYVLKSNVVNAVCMPDGSIFITVGLLSQIESEAQLAFVLAHEISHYTLKHGIKTYANNDKLRKRYNRSKIEYDEAITDLSEYSKDQELESDKEGYKMYKKAGYDSDEAMKMLLVLQYSHLPFDELKFEETFFNKGRYKIPSEYFDKDELTKEIEDNSNKDDTYSSHPNIKTRIENLNIEILNIRSEKVGVTSYGMDLDFEYIQTKARFENQYLNILKRKFIKTIFESYLLKKKYPNNKFLDECIAKSLYALSKNRTNNSHISFDTDIEGSSLVLVDLFQSKMDVKEMNVLALKKMLELDTEVFKPYVEDLIMDLVKRNGMNYNSFYYKESGVKLDTSITNTDSIIIVKPKEIPKFVVLDSAEYAVLTKVGKIKYNRAKQKHYTLLSDTVKSKSGEVVKSIKSDYYKAAFYEKGLDADFKKLFDDTKGKELKTYFKDLEYSEKVRIRKKRESESAKFKKIKLDSILILESTYEVFNRKDKIDSKNSYKLNEKFIKSIGDFAENSDVSYLNINSNENDNMSIDLINAKYSLKEWRQEMNESYDNKMLSLTQDRANEIFDKIGYDNILVSGVSSDFNKLSINVGYKFVTLVFAIPLAPAIIPFYFLRFNKFNTTKYIHIMNREGYTVLYNRFESNKGANYKQDEVFIENTLNQITK